jgi:hypothetical protein
MAITGSKGSGTDFKVDPIPAETYVSRCVGIFDLGTQHAEKWDKWIRKVIFQWEITEVRMQYEKDGEQIDNPRVASREVSLSLHKKSVMRGLLESWRGVPFTEEELAGFDILNVLEAPCMVQILNVQGTGANADRVYSNVGTVSKVYKGIDVPDQELETRYFSFEETNTYAQLMEKKDIIPEWIWNKIEKSKEYRALKDRAANFAPGDEESQTGGEHIPEEDDGLPPF